MTLHEFADASLKDLVSVRYWGGGSDYQGLVNVVLYPPGTPCLAMRGSPVNPQFWSVVTWGVGRLGQGEWDLLRSFPDRESALAFIAQSLNLSPGE